MYSEVLLLNFTHIIHLHATGPKTRCCILRWETLWGKLPVEYGHFARRNRHCITAMPWIL